MKIQIKKENITHDGYMLTRIEYSDKSFNWYHNFNNEGIDSLDEVDFGKGKLLNKLEKEYQKIKL